MSMKKSAVWHYFKAEDGRFAVCKLCRIRLSRGGEGKKAGTTSLKRHLRSKHPEKFFKSFGRLSTSIGSEPFSSTSTDGGDGDNSNSEIDSTSPVMYEYEQSTGVIPAMYKDTESAVCPETCSRFTTTDNSFSNKTVSSTNKLILADEFQIYGSYVASQLKLLSEEQSVIARDKIQSILTQSRLHDLRSGKHFMLESKNKTNASSDTEAVIQELHYVLYPEEIKIEVSDDEGIK